jgi:protein-disulfide isomerase
VRSGKVKMEYRGFPFLGSDSLKGERFLLAASLQNRLWQLYDAFYRNQGAERSGWLTDDLIRTVASQISGLDVAKLFADAQKSSTTQAADRAAKDASAAGIGGTPTLLVQIGAQAPYPLSSSVVFDPTQLGAALDDALKG